MKDMNPKWLLTGGIGLIIFLIFFALSQCDDNKNNFVWKDSFSQKITQPYGSYLVYQRLQDIFTDDSIEIIEQGLFEQLVYEFPVGVSYILVNGFTPLYEEDFEELRTFVERGNHLFMVSSYFSDDITDSLGFYLSDYTHRDSVSIHFTSSADSSQWYDFVFSYMTYLDIAGDSATNVEVLAETREGDMIFVRKKMGDGWLYICTLPRIFTNYYMVHPENHNVISRMLSFLPRDEEIWWDEFYKPGNKRMDSRSGDVGGNSPRDKLDFIFEHESLSWAFWLAILGLLLYALFEGKRKQRLIPIIKPLPNMTLDYTETIGRLYFQSKDHKNIAEKRIRTLLAYIREHYFLKTDIINEDFLTSLSAKSDLQLTDVRQLFRMIKQIQESEQITETKLIELSMQIDHFYRKGSR